MMQVHAEKKYFWGRAGLLPVVILDGQYSRIDYLYVGHSESHFILPLIIPNSQLFLYNPMMSSARKMTSWDSRVMGDLYKFSGLQGEDHERGLLGCILRLWKNVFEE